MSRPRSTLAGAIWKDGLGIGATIHLILLQRPIHPCEWHQLFRLQVHRVVVLYSEFPQHREIDQLQRNVCVLGFVPTSRVEKFGCAVGARKEVFTGQASERAIGEQTATAGPRVPGGSGVTVPLLLLSSPSELGLCEQVRCTWTAELRVSQ